MFNIKEWDEVLGEDELYGDGTKKEFMEYHMDGWDPEEEEYEEEYKHFEEQWDEIQKGYKEYVENYYDDIGSKLDGEEDNYSVCPYCGKSDEFENYDYTTGDYEVECSRCDSEYSIYIEDAGYGDFTIKTVRPECKRSEHHFIFMKESTEKWNFHRINFPYEKTHKYYCLKCGKEEYRPLDSEGKELSRKQFKRLQKKHEEGFQKIKLSGSARIFESTWRDNIAIKVQFSNEEEIDKCLERVKKRFRDSIKDIISKEEATLKGRERISVKYDRVYEITLKTGVTFTMAWNSKGFELSFKEIEGYVKKKEPLRIANRLEKFINSLGIEVQNECFKEENKELPNDIKRDMKNLWEGYPLNHKKVAVRGEYDGVIRFVGTAYCRSESTCQNNVTIINGADYARAFKSNVEEIAPGIKYRDTSKIRERRLIEELRKASENWDFEKATILRDILIKEGYKKAS